MPVKSGTGAAELATDNWQLGTDFYGKTNSSSSGRHTSRAREKRQEENLQEEGAQARPAWHRARASLLQ
ncbi:hypothetical protein SBA1_100015 [Candidatus Sulfotelmatobacter kueseliae]|uniref:Uncharacterized protein n=1 Tax=Candidatus Sulfotelmatobacter kueseliae TaxID=2042962 RepID=A0A2U3JW22_9BACT|nr:hypothetical protein SBA1_100015 [Candidatus Sulfotelmatobacter kueseliae]